MLFKVWRKAILYTAGTISVAYEEARKAVRDLANERRRRPAKRAR
jgi:hypothetical protein